MEPFAGSPLEPGEDGGTLDRRSLNRATLARQMLLERSPLGVEEAVARLVGLQAQTPHTWYVGLWTRLHGFRPEVASDLLAARRLVRIALMRSTIHLVTADDCLALRPVVQRVIERSMRGNFGKRLAGIDPEVLAATGRELVEARPLTFADLGRRLAERWPDRDSAALVQGVRAWVPLVQTPPRGLWGRSGPVTHTSAEAWLGRPLGADPDPAPVVLRYLAAFGPASVRDAQAWSGLTRLAEVLDRLRPRLVTFRDERGTELFDLPDAPRPAPDAPAAPRFLYDYDNLLLSHADRARFITDAYFRQGFTDDGPMPRIVLLDGFTAGVWTTDTTRTSAVLTIRPFAPLAAADEAALADEGAALLAMLAPTAARDIRFAPPL